MIHLLLFLLLTLAKHLLLQPTDLMRDRGYVCVLEFLPHFAQSFRLLLLLFLKFWFIILNSSCHHCIAKALSVVSGFKNGELPKDVFVLWLWALKLNLFRIRWKCCSALILPNKRPLRFHSSLLCCFFSASNACKCCPQSRLLLCHMLHITTNW